MSEVNITPEVTPVGKTETEQSRIRKNNFPFFGIAGGLYALFYTFCMYRNTAGITYPFFILGSLFFFCFCMQKLGISVKRGSIFYMVGMILLGISTVCTADGRIIFFNHAGVLLLMISFLLHQFYEDANWGFGKYLASILCTVFGSIGEITKPFTDFAHYRSRQGKGQEGKTGKVFYVAIGLCVAFPVLSLVWFLLMTADRVFMNMTEELFEALDLTNLLGILASTGFMFLAAYGVISYLCEKHLGDGEAEQKKAESTLAITVTLPLVVLYLVFCVIQVVYLFLGKGNLNGMSYAEYARQGFFQLLFVCILNLILVLAGGHYFKESKALKAILTVMSLCTYIMIFSSGMRMILYIKHYYLTFLRILVLWALVVIFLLLTGVLVSIFLPKFPLFRYGIAVVSVCYIALSFSRPDYLIASCNLGNVQEENVHNFFDADAYHDYRYVWHLSADAAPVILEFLGTQKTDESGNWGEAYVIGLQDAVEDNGARTFNFSRHIAAKALKEYQENS